MLKWQGKRFDSQAFDLQDVNQRLRQTRYVTIVDTFTRECLAIDADSSRQRPRIRILDTWIEGRSKRASHWIFRVPASRQIMPSSSPLTAACAMSD